MSIILFLFCVDVVALLVHKCGARRLDNLEEDVRTRLWVLKTDTFDLILNLCWSISAGTPCFDFQISKS